MTRLQVSVLRLRPVTLSAPPGKGKIRARQMNPGADPPVQRPNGDLRYEQLAMLASDRNEDVAANRPR